MSRGDEQAGDELAGDEQAGDGAVPNGDAEVTLRLLLVSPMAMSLVEGSSLQLTALGVYSDFSTQDVTAMVRWSSSEPAIAAVSNSSGSYGMVSASSEGSVTLSATSGDLSGSMQLVVYPAPLVSLTVAPDQPQVAHGLPVVFSAIGIFANGSAMDMSHSVAWSSSNEAVATISNQAPLAGVAASLSVGKSTITARAGLVAAATELTVTAAELVSLVILSDTLHLAEGTSLQLAAIGAYTDGSSQDLTEHVTWVSSDPALFSFDGGSGLTGVVVAKAQGQGSVVATRAGLSSAAVQLTVTPAVLRELLVTPAQATLPLGLSRHYVATGRYTNGVRLDLTASALWGSSDDTLAVVYNDGDSAGLVEALAEGNVTLTASLGLVSGTATLTVVPVELESIAIIPPSPFLTEAMSIAFRAIGYYNDGTSADLTASASWDSSSDSVALIDALTGQTTVAAPARFQC